MSTKTTFKRIALVTVAALGLGAFAVAPSQAVQQMDTLSISSATATQETRTTTGTGLATATLAFLGSAGVDTMTVTASLVSGPAGNTVLPLLAVTESTTTNSSATVSGLTLTSVPTGANKYAAAKFTVALNSPTVVGDYTIKLTPAVTGGTPNATAVTVKITVSAAAAPVAPTTTASRVYMRSGSVTGAGNIATAAYASGGYQVVPTDSTTPLTRAAVVAGLAGHIAAQDANTSNVASLTVNTSSYTLNDVGTKVATFAVIVANGDTITASTITNAVQHVPGGTSAQTVNYAPTTEDYFTAAGFPVTATISGPGYIWYDGVVRGKTYTELSTDGQVNYVQKSFAVVYAGDGNGVATVKFSAGGVVLATRTINWSGAATGYVFGTPSKTIIGVGETASVTITGTDALGTSTGAASVWAASSDATVATVNSDQASTVVITGVKSGKATITVRNNADATLATITKTLEIKVGAVTAKTVTFSVDNASPQPGEKVTLTVEALDASGNPVGDGSRNLFSSAGITTGLAVQGATWTASAAVALVGGKASYTFYAPTGTGSLAISATQGTALDNVVADATTATTISTTVTVVNPTLDASLDAANEATDAANAATDAALAAAEAADAATTAAQEASDAVAALSESVTKLIAGLQAQIKSLAAVVAKIAKKVKA